MADRVCPICEKFTRAEECPADGFPTLPVDACTRRLPDDVAGWTFEGKYRIVRELGAGGMGRVFLAQQRFIDRSVALKCLRPDVVAAPQTRLRFLNEARILSRMSHPNTVRVYDFGVSREGILFLVMEYVEGRSLDTVLRAEGPLAPARAIDIAVQVLHSLDEVHRGGVVHRDLKPSNVLLTSVGGKPDFVKVFDFGIAREQDPDGATVAMTGRGVFVGTARYASPEQAVGRPDLDARSDLFTMGTLLYEMLTGRPPFDGATMMDCLFQILREPTAPIPDRVLRTLGPILPDCLARALEKERDRRFGTAKEMIQALQAARHALPDLPRPEGVTTEEMVLPTAFGKGSETWDAPAAHAETSDEAFPAPEARAPDSAASPAEAATAISAPPAPPESTREGGSTIAPISRPWRRVAVGAGLLFVVVAVVLALRGGGGEPAPSDARADRGRVEDGAVASWVADDVATGADAPGTPGTAVVTGEPAEVAPDVVPRGREADGPDASGATEGPPAGDAAVATDGGGAAPARREPRPQPDPRPPRRPIGKPPGPEPPPEPEAGRCVCRSKADCLNKSRFFVGSGRPLDAAACLRRAQRDVERGGAEWDLIQKQLERLEGGR